MDDKRGAGGDQKRPAQRGLRRVAQLQQEIGTPRGKAAKGQDETEQAEARRDHDGLLVTALLGLHPSILPQPGWRWLHAHAARNLDYMITEQQMERVRGWFTGRLPSAWQEQQPARITVDREEITVIISLPDVDLPEEEGASDAERSEARAGRARAFREETRERRMEIDREAQHRFERKVSWGVDVGGRSELWTNVAAPVMTRLRQAQRQVLDTLVASGVAKSRSEALAWCVRLVGQHEEDWLQELRDAMDQVADVRGRGPAA